VRFTIKTRVSTKSAALEAELSQALREEAVARGRHKIADKVDAAVNAVRCFDHPDFRVSATRDTIGGYADDVLVCCAAIQEPTRVAVRTAFGK